jgi:hypothetical protein
MVGYLTELKNVSAGQMTVKGPLDYVSLKDQVPYSLNPVYIPTMMPAHSAVTITGYMTGPLQLFSIVTYV